MVSLSSSRPRLDAVTVGLRWDVRGTSGVDFDLDAAALLCGADGRVLADHDFVFFNNLRSTDGSVEHRGDSLTGEGDGDDEQIRVNLTLIRPDIQAIVLTVSLWDAETRNHSFGQVGNAIVRVFNPAYDGTELARINVSETFPTESALVFGELYRDGGEWKFRAVGRGYASLREIAVAHGVDV